MADDDDVVCDEAGGRRPQPLPAKTRDCWCCLVFVVFWVGMAIVAVVGFATGDARRLIFATDYLGNTCGACQDGKSCGKQIYYPRPGYDALAQGYNPLAVSSEPQELLAINFFGICMDACPAPGMFVCTYEMEAELQARFSSTRERDLTLTQCLAEQNGKSLGVLNNFGASALGEPCRTYMDQCWLVTQPQTSLFFRCLPNSAVNTTVDSTCFHPKFQDEEHTLIMPATVCPDQLAASRIDPHCEDADCFARTGKPCQQNTRCASVLEKRTSFSVENPNADVVSIMAEQLGSWTATFARSLGDVEMTWWTILLVGLLGAAILGYAWIALLEYAVGVFVWVMIVLSLVGMVLCSLLCFVKAGRWQQGLTWVHTETNDTRIAAVFSSVGGDDSMWFFFGVLLAVLSCVYFLVIVVMRGKIRLAIAMFEEGSKAVQELQSVLFMPVFSCVCALVVVLYGVGVFGYLFTSGSKVNQNLTIESLRDGVLSEASDWGEVVTETAAGRRALLPADHRDMVALARDARLLLEFNLTKTIDTGLTTIVAGVGVDGMILYHLFGFLWTLQVINAINMLTISIAVSRWYWSRGEREMSVVAAYYHTVRYFFGSACMGAFLIAVMKFLRILLYYFDKQTTSLQEKNSFLKVIINVLNICLGFVEKILKYVVSYAFIVVGMYGCGFWTGAHRAVRVMTDFDNLARIGAVHFLSKFVSLLSVLVVTTSCVLLEMAWLENDASFQYGGERYVSSITLSVGLCGGAAFWVAVSFMQVYEVAVETILMCFCIDIELNRGTKEYFMSDDLRKIFSRKKSKRGKRGKKGKKVGAAEPKPGANAVAPA